MDGRPEGTATETKGRLLIGFMCARVNRSRHHPAISVLFWVLPKISNTVYSTRELNAGSTDNDRNFAKAAIGPAGIPRRLTS